MLNNFNKSVVWIKKLKWTETLDEKCLEQNSLLKLFLNEM